MGYATIGYLLLRIIIQITLGVFETYRPGRDFISIIIQPWPSILLTVKLRISLTIFTKNLIACAFIITFVALL